jgi:hypothetical protein
MEKSGDLEALGFRLREAKVLDVLIQHSVVVS